jgi:SAM-dependent methyltransferase
MTGEEYDAWYRTPRGSWIGDTEYQLLYRLLAPEPGASLLDVGCGTGYFTHRFALDGHPATGLDLDAAMLDVARARRVAGERYVRGNALALPFQDGEFDCAVSVAALCFIADEAAALTEMLRVTRHRLALGLLHRRSILYLQKGREGGKGAYRGAHWHTPREVRELFARVDSEAAQLKFAVFLPSGNMLARWAELAIPKSLPLGSFLAVCGAVNGNGRSTIDMNRGDPAQPAVPSLV